MLKIAIDIMGGDNSPAEPIHGIKSYIKDSLDKNAIIQAKQIAKSNLINKINPQLI